MAAEIRASYTKVGLRHFKRAHAVRWEDLAAELGESPLRDVLEASGLDWIPAELHGAVADAMIDVVGRAEARAIWADVIYEAFDSRMLSPIVSGALRLYGKKPPSVMRMTPHAWPLVFRKCGRSWMEPVSDNEASMLFAELARPMVESTGILDSFLANCDAALRYTGFAGSAVPSYDKIAEGGFSIEVRWHEGLTVGAHKQR